MPADLPSTQRLPPAPARTPLRGRGTSILFRHYPGGVVTASSQGFTGVGTGEMEAMAELTRLIRQARRAAANPPPRGLPQTGSPDGGRCGRG